MSIIGVVFVEQNRCFLFVDGKGDPNGNSCLCVWFDYEIFPFLYNNSKLQILNLGEMIVVTVQIKRDVKSSKTRFIYR